MKTKFYFLLFPLLLMNSCKMNPQKDVKKSLHGVRVEREYFSNGKVKTEIKLKNNVRDGLTRNFDRDGQLLSEVNYVNNVREGTAKNYYPTSGKVSSVFTYVKGVKQGDETWYYESGKPYRITPYVNDKIEGMQKKFYEDGKLLSEVPYKNDMPGSGLKEYYNTGKLFTDYPSIVFKKEDHLANANMILVMISLSNSSRDVKFYRGTLSEGKYLTDKIMPMATRDGETKISYTVPPGTMIRQTITVCARYNTPNGNPYVIQKSFTVVATNKN